MGARRCRVTTPTVPPKEEKERFPLPDKNQELHLAGLQTQTLDHYKAGAYRQALRSGNTLLQETEAHFGNDHPATASAMLNLGLVEKQLGHWDDSRRYYEQARKIYGRVVGKDHASYASALHNLAQLNRSQIHFDQDLKATDRLTLLEQAVDLLQQAYNIRKQELGAEHPHTVSTQSTWGSALAAQLLQHYKQQQKRQDPAGSNHSDAYYYVSTLPSHVTEQGWQAAEEHLREALATACAHPRGPRLPKKQRAKPKVATMTNTNIATTGTVPLTLETLSAANAAMNLAIVLKARASTDERLQTSLWKEARSLYEQVLYVRKQLLPSLQHPDIMAAKYSYAELLDAMGETDAANIIRQDILDLMGDEEEGMEEKEEDDEKLKTSKDTTMSEDPSGTPKP